MPFSLAQLRSPVSPRSLRSLIAAALLAACADAGVAPESWNIVAESAPPAPVVGKTIEAAVMVEVNGAPRAGAPISWTPSTGAVASATTQTDASGRATVQWTLGPTAGTQTLKAAGPSGALPATISVTAGADLPARIVFAVDSLLIDALGDSAAVSASVTDQFGNPLGATATLSIEGTDVAQVTSGSFVRAVANGAAFVRATADTASDSLRVVVSQAADSLAISVADSALTYGSASVASVSAFDRGGSPIASPAITWTSLDPGVVSVDATGAYTAAGVGTGRIQAASGSATAVAEVVVDPAMVALPALAGSVTPGQLFTVTPPESFTFPDAVFPGLIGQAGDSLWFANDDSGAARALLPSLAPGAVEIILPLDANHIGVVSVQVAAPATVADPAASLTTVATKLDAIVADLVADPSEGNEATTFAAAAAEAFQAWRDTASAESLQMAALFIETNPEMQALLALSEPDAGTGDIAFSLVPNCATSDVPEDVLARCKKYTAFAVAAFVGGVLTIETACFQPATPWACAGSVLLLGGGAAVAYKSSRRLHRAVGRIVDNIATTFTFRDDFGGGGARPGLSISNNTAALELLSGASYDLLASATYRSVNASDVSGFMGEVASVLGRVRKNWLKLEGLVDKIPSFVRSRLPDLPAAPEAVPATAAASLSASVHPQFLTVSCPSPELVTQFDAATGRFTASIAPGVTTTEVALACQMNYSSEIGSQSAAITGVVRSGLVVGLAGGSGQTGRGARALPTPLQVRVTDAAHSGAGVAGVTVHWTVTNGGGSIPATSTTGADGIASAVWTLGAEQVPQTVEAVAVRDGMTISGSPVVFGATVSDMPGPYTLTIIDALGGAETDARDMNDDGVVVGRALGLDGNHHGFVWSDGAGQKITTKPSFAATDANGVNAAGHVVGSQSYHAFVWRNGVLTELPDEEVVGTGRAMAINDAGTIVGYSKLFRAAMWNASGLTLLGGAAGDYTRAVDINESGTIVGSIGSSQSAMVATRWSGTTPSDLGFGSGSTATEINESGTIVGYQLAGGCFTPKVWRAGVVTTLPGLFPGQCGQIAGINDDEDMVGGLFGASAVAVLWRNGIPYDLNTLVPDLPENVALFTATAINTRGQIVGSAFVDGKRRGFLLTPR